MQWGRDNESSGRKIPRLIRGTAIRGGTKSADDDNEISGQDSEPNQEIALGGGLWGRFGKDGGRVRDSRKSEVK